MQRIDDRFERNSFWTKKRNPDLWFKLPVAVAITLLHAGWHNAVLAAVIAAGELLALGFRHKSYAGPLSILRKE